MNSVQVLPNQSSLKIVSLYSSEVRAGTYLISQGFGKRHKDVLELIRKYESDFLDFGRLKRHKYVSTGGRPIEEFLLNEEQAILLGSYFSNTEIIREFKKTIVREFSLMKKALLNQSNLEWKQQREQGKLIRRQEADAIQTLVDYAIQQGSQNAKFYFTHITNATYKALGLIQHKEPQLRETLDTLQLNQLLLAENIACKSIIKHIKAGHFYKDIFKLVKLDIEAFAGTLMLSENSLLEEVA